MKRCNDSVKGDVTRGKDYCHEKQAFESARLKYRLAMHIPKPSLFLEHKVVGYG
jgi:hypothetical protein